MAIRFRHPIVGASLLALWLAPSPVAAASPGDEAVALASLLQASDVFPSAAPDGVSEGVADDLPAFAANGGLREVSQTWTSTDPVALVFDFRFQFPDEASARAFLDASEADLGEVARGAQRTPLLDPPLPDTRYYVTNGSGAQGVGYDYLMRHRNLVSKVYIGGSADDVTQTRAGIIGHAAAARMVAALADVAASPAASEAPPPLPEPDAAAVARLIAQAPEPLRAKCAVEPFTPADGPRDGELARVSCASSRDATIRYAAFDSASSVGAAFEAARFVAQMFGTLTIAGTCVGGGYDGTWTSGGTDAGMLLCYGLEGDELIDWSDPGQLLVGSVRQPGGDPAAAWQAWLEAGAGTRAQGQ